MEEKGAKHQNTKMTAAVICVHKVNWTIGKCLTEMWILRFVPFVCTKCQLMLADH